MILSKEQALKLLQDQPDLVEELLKNEITKEDLANLAYRRSQLEGFSKMLYDPSYFESCRKTLGRNKGPEGVWQDFFERNPWIFGYGLSYFFNMPLEGAKLEQVVSGADFSKRGKRVDALLKTQGVISALAFGEIKTHTTPLLTQSSIPYRGESWAISKEVSGGIAQVQRAVQRSIENLLTKIELKDKQGNLSGDQLFLYHPRSFLVVGSLSEFDLEHGVNEEKYSSFELFRLNLQNPEIITFDELHERARYIVESESMLHGRP